MNISKALYEIEREIERRDTEKLQLKLKQMTIEELKEFQKKIAGEVNKSNINGSLV